MIVTKRMIINAVLFRGYGFAEENAEMWLKSHPPQCRDCPVKSTNSSGLTGELIDSTILLILVRRCGATKNDEE